MGPTELRSKRNRYNVEYETADRLIINRNIRKKGKEKEERYCLGRAAGKDSN